MGGTAGAAARSGGSNGGGGGGGGGGAGGGVTRAAWLVNFLPVVAPAFSTSRAAAAVPSLITALGGGSTPSIGPGIGDSGRSLK